MLRASGCVTLDISIVGGRVHSRIFVVDDLLMFLVLDFEWICMSADCSGFLVRDDGRCSIVGRGVIVFL